MKSSSFILKRLVSVPIIAVVAMQLQFISNVSSLNLTNAYLHHECLNSEGTYKPGSLYEKNVKRAIDMAPEDITEDSMLHGGFVGTSVGDSPDFVAFRNQCRGDLSISQCLSCITTAFSEVRKRCPNNKGRIIWYDYCVMEISSDDRMQLDYHNYFYLYNAKDVSGHKESFNEKTRSLLYKLKEKARVEKFRIRKNFSYATGEESFRTMKLYGMVQCMKDLSRKNCRACLNGILEKLPKCCNGKQGGRVLCTNCNFRYELYPFVKTLG